MIRVRPLVLLETPRVLERAGLGPQATGPTPSPIRWRVYPASAGAGTGKAVGLGKDAGVELATTVVSASTWGAVTVAGAARVTGRAGRVDSVLCSRLAPPSLTGRSVACGAPTTPAGVETAAPGGGGVGEGAVSLLGAERVPPLAAAVVARAESSGSPAAGRSAAGPTSATQP